jgi:hypothetical protein
VSALSIRSNPRPRPSPRRHPAPLLIAASCLALLFLGGEPALADGKAHEYVGAKKCKSCHKKDAIGNQYGVWLDSKHAKAFENLASDKAKEWASEAGVADAQADEKCVKCHVTAYGAPEELVSKKFDRTLGVQCESCHGAGKDFRKKKIMVDRELAISKGLIIPDEELCTKCHNDESPAWDPQRYTRADGTKVGFDFEQAKEAIAHPVPEGYDPMAEGEAD